MESEVMRMVAAALVMGAGTLGPALAIGALGYGALQSLGRNPEARHPILTTAVLGIAFAEAIAIYALIVAILILTVA